MYFNKIQNNYLCFVQVTNIQGYLCISNQKSNDFRKLLWEKLFTYDENLKKFYINLGIKKTVPDLDLYQLDKDY